jgi:F0F1-type ATP synthase assembly protein I
VLVRGKLAYFGESQEMLSYFQARRPHEIFDKLKEQEPEQWAAQYRKSDAFRESVGSALENDVAGKKRPAVKQSEAPRRSAWRQLSTLLSRQFALKFKEKSTLAAILLPPVIVAVLMGIMKQTVNEPKVLFMVVLVALWFGCSSSVREIVDELPVYKRERQRDLKLSSYVGSKLIYVGAVAGMQSLLFIAVLAGMGAVENHLAECFALMWLLTLVGGLMGLLISSVFSTAEKALYAFPLTMIPQLLLAGLLIPVNTIHSFYAVEQPNQKVELRELPATLIPTGMTPALKYGLSPLMVSRWGLEGIVDLYIHDGEKYSYLLLNNIYTSLHPDDLMKARAEAARKIREVDPRPAKLGPTVFWRYFGIVAGYGGLLVGGIIIALRRKEHHAG